MAVNQATQVKTEFLDALDREPALLTWIQEGNFGLLVLQKASEEFNFWASGSLAQDFLLNDTASNPLHIFSAKDEQFLRECVTTSKPIYSWRTLNIRESSLKIDCQLKFIPSSEKEQLALLVFRTTLNDDPAIDTILSQDKSELTATSLRFQSLVENAQDAILILDESGTPTYASNAIEDILGYTKEETLNINMFEVCHPDFMDKIKSILVECLENPGVTVVKEASKWKHKDGSWRWLEGLLTNKLHDPAIRGIVDNFRDITELVEASLVLERQSELRGILVDLSMQYINLPVERASEVIDQSLERLGKFVHADRVYIFDYHFEQEYLTNTHEWCAPGITEEIDNLRHVPIEVLNQPWVINHKRGLPVHIPDVRSIQEDSLRTLLQEQDIKSLLTIPLMVGADCVGFVGFDRVRSYHVFSREEIELMSVFAKMLVNFREQTNKERSLTELVEQVESQNQRLLDFSFITSHNMRSSIANLMGITDVIALEGNHDEYVGMMRKSTERLDTTVKNINELIHFENQLSEKNTISCSLLEFVNRVIVNNQLLVEELEADIEVRIPPDQVVFIIPAYLESILHNLVHNALTYGIDDKHKKIVIATEETDHTLAIKVQDFGPGIDLKRFEKKLFTLGGRFTSNSKGQGVGLFMSKRQIEALGGQLYLDTELNKGCIFTAEFPKS
ncbi:PAS domain S-box protein [Croceiramulus getboli]|nr:PAS domain S-box protein [Flavobacteriaceae bacterium YJPT1-3]